MARSTATITRRHHEGRSTVALLVAIGAMMAATLGLVATPLTAAALASGSVRPDGLIALRDNLGISVIDPTNGHQHQLLSVPGACSAYDVGGIPAIQLAGPVWATSGGSVPGLYFWLTDWMLKAGQNGCKLPAAPSALAERAVMVEANPVTGAMRVVAAVPADQACEPGADLAAGPGALAFTDGGCDVPAVLSLALPLTAKSQPLTARPARPNMCRCAAGSVVLGPGPDGRFLTMQIPAQTSNPPPPSLQWFSPVSGAVALLSPTPPVPKLDIVAAAASPNGAGVAFAAAKAGAGVLDLKTGSWTTEPLPACPGSCGGPEAVSWSPDGGQIAFAANGNLVVDQAAGGSAHAVFMRGAGTSDVSWSGPIASAALASGPPTGIGAALVSFTAALAKAGVTSTTRVWSFPGA